MSDNELTPTDEELREAEALRAALDGDASQAEPPAETMEAASLLHATRQRVTLDDVTHESVMRRVLAGVPTSAPHRRSVRVVFGAIGLGVAVAAAAMLVVLRPAAPASVSTLPVAAPAAAPAAAGAERAAAAAPAAASTPTAPPKALLAALASARVGMTAAEVAIIQRETAAHRHALLASAATYGGAP